MAFSCLAGTLVSRQLQGLERNQDALERAALNTIEEGVMAYKSIVAIASGQDSDSQVFNAAARLASQFSAHARVVPAYSDPAADFIAYGAALEGVSAAILERVRESERAQQQKLENRLSEAAARAGVLFGSKADGASIGAAERALMPSQAIAEASVLADLVLFAGDVARGSLSGAFAETLLEARAPILIVNDDQFSLGAVAIAWDGSPQAGRAARAAMPLLAAADEVVLIQNVSDMNDRSRAGASDAFAAYLGRHGVSRVRRLGVEGDNVAQSLLRGAHEAGCSTLVAGAYGRPRLYELALGGTTRALVHAKDRLHLFLAH
jgi:nucleotide-binding universal stress UspA family protein